MKLCTVLVAVHVNITLVIMFIHETAVIVDVNTGLVIVFVRQESRLFVTCLKSDQP